MRFSRRDTLKALGGALALGTVGATGATAADDESGGNAGTAIALDYLANDDLLDNAELETILQGLAEEHEMVSVSTIGESNQGRPIYAAAVGTGDKNVMAISQQHGDETISSAEGVLAAIRYLVGDDERTTAMTDEVTLHVVPRVNPDGFVARQRYNVDTDAPARGDDAGIFSDDAGFFTAEEEGIGWDVNRYNWADWTDSNLYQEFPDEYPENPVPESRAVIGAIDDVDPDWVIDFHRQGTYVVNPDVSFDSAQPDADLSVPYPPDPADSGAGTLVTGSLFWPINEDAPKEAQDLSKQMVATMYEELSAYDRATYTRYPGGTYAGIARNAYGIDGRGSVLFELSAGTLGDREFRIRQVLEALLTTIEATADGSLYDVDPSAVEDLPERESRDFTV